MSNTISFTANIVALVVLDAAATLSGRTLTIAVTNVSGATSTSLTGLTLDGADVLANSTGTGPWEYVVPDHAGEDVSISWQVQADGSGGGAVKDGSLLVEANLFAPEPTSPPEIIGTPTPGSTITVVEGTYTGTSPISVVGVPTFGGVDVSADMVGLDYTIPADATIGTVFEWEETASNTVSPSASTSVSVVVEDPAAATSDLMTALTNAVGGDTILLDPGNYGYLDLNGYQRTPAVTVKSANVADKAVFTGLKLVNVHGLHIEDIDVNSFYSGADYWTQVCRANSDCDNLAFRRINFFGKNATGTDNPEIEGYPTGTGLDVGSSTNIVIDDCLFDNWYRGFNTGAVTGLDLLNSEFVRTAADSTQFNSMTNVLIEGNTFRDFILPETGVHRDMIQFFTRDRVVASYNITIRRNIFDIAAGVGTQSIFMRNEAVDLGTAPDAFYENVVVEDNVIFNGQGNFVVIGEAIGVTVRRNSLVNTRYLSGENYDSPVITVKPSTDVVVEENIAAGFPSGSAASNVLLPMESYLDTFITSTFTLNDGRNRWVLKPDAPANAIATTLGIQTIKYNAEKSVVTPYFDVNSDSADTQRVHFDASMTAKPAGVTLAATDYSWNFGDGSPVVTGAAVDHIYAAPGYYTPVLTVQGGPTTQYKVGLAGFDLLRFDPLVPQFTKLGYGLETVPSQTDTLPMVGDALKIGGTDIQASVDDLERFIGTSKCEVAMTLKTDVSGGSGIVCQIYTVFEVSVLSSGAVRFKIQTPENTVTLTSSGVVVNDTAAHDIVCKFDGDAGAAEILVDAVSVGTISVSGALSPQDRGLWFGTPFNGTNLPGEISAFTLGAKVNDYPAYVAP